MVKAVFFDLDGTLLPLEEDKFMKYYFGLLSKKLAPYGYEAEPLVKHIWGGVKAMCLGDGTKTNFDLFWEYFYAQDEYKNKERTDISVFDDFYSHEFCATKGVTEENPLAKEIVKFCKKKVGVVALTTNPVFPMIGQQTRIGFLGLKPTDFDLVTAYETSHFCKPDPRYFQEVLAHFGLKGEEVVLFGNNTYEDGECALGAGIKCYIVEGHVIDHPKAKHTFPRIKMEEIIPTIEKLLQE